MAAAFGMRSRCRSRRKVAFALCRFGDREQGDRRADMRRAVECPGGKRLRRLVEGIGTYYGDRLPVMGCVDCKAG